MKMKKTLLIVALVVLALGALSVGVVAAQGGQPPVGGFGPGMMWDGETGPLHDYMVKAMLVKPSTKLHWLKTILPRKSPP
jgi:Spy/CpxP family protein refolding chaperone